MALEAISSWEEIALQFQIHQIRGREPFYGLSLHQLRPVQTKATNQCEQKSQVTAIRCSIDFCVMLCNEQAKKQKNTAQMRHSCALFDALSIFVQCCATSKPIGSCACLAGGCGCARADSVRGRGAATRGKCRRCSVPGWQAAKP